MSIQATPRATTHDDSVGPSQVADMARALRVDAFTMVHEARMGHLGGDFSAADILATLYFGIMRFDPERPNAPERDRFIMSKGHASASLYATLAQASFIPREALRTYMRPLSLLNGHPNRNYVPGVEANTGPLGHGFPIAVGIAVAGQIDKADFRTFVLIGDGETQEGSNWEAAMFAGHRKLANLTLIVDRNRLQQGARVADTNDLEPLADKLRAFNFEVVEVDGHDHAALLKVFAPRANATQPLAVIAHTIKGKGVSFMEDQVGWHHGVPGDAQFAQAMAELKP
jgi:transketolase